MTVMFVMTVGVGACICHGLYYCFLYGFALYFFSCGVMQLDLVDFSIF